MTLPRLTSLRPSSAASAAAGEGSRLAPRGFDIIKEEDDEDNEDDEDGNDAFPKVSRSHQRFQGKEPALGRVPSRSEEGDEEDDDDDDDTLEREVIFGGNKTSTPPKMLSVPSASPRRSDPSPLSSPSSVNSTGRRSLPSFERGARMSCPTLPKTARPSLSGALMKKSSTPSLSRGTSSVPIGLDFEGRQENSIGTDTTIKRLPPAASSAAVRRVPAAIPQGRLPLIKESKEGGKLPE